MHGHEPMYKYACMCVCVRASVREKDVRKHSGNECTHAMQCMVHACMCVSAVYVRMNMHHACRLSCMMGQEMLCTMQDGVTYPRTT